LLAGDRLAPRESGALSRGESCAHDGWWLAALSFFAPPIEPPFTTFEALFGNYVVEVLGDHRFAVYAHLHTGSVRVRAGERVHRGQVLGLVGNTGNSTEPHLHFQVTSGPSPAGSDGVPYVFRSFRYDARLVGLDTGNPAIVPAGPPRTRHRQLPLDDDIIAFPPR